MPGDGARDRPGDRRAARTIVSRVLAALGGLLAWFAFVAPNEMSRLTPSAFVRIPLEGLLFVALTLVLPPRAGRMTAALVGVLLGLLTLVKLLDWGFLGALADRSTQ